MQDIEKLEATLWEAADNLRANSHKSSSEYCMPVLGVIFLRHATNRYDAACGEIAREQAAGKMPKRPLDRKGTNAGRGEESHSGSRFRHAAGSAVYGSKTS
jgi:type I restriction-modification system DNA methylase subunit